MAKCLICTKKVKFVDSLVSCQYCQDNKVGVYCTFHNHKEQHSCPDLNIKKKVDIVKIETEKIIKI
jgi:hypothetical protein